MCLWLINHLCEQRYSFTSAHWQNQHQREVVVVADCKLAAELNKSDAPDATQEHTAWSDFITHFVLGNYRELRCNKNTLFLLYITYLLLLYFYYTHKLLKLDENMIKWKKKKDMFLLSVVTLYRKFTKNVVICNLPKIYIKNAFNLYISKYFKSSPLVLISRSKFYFIESDVCL